MDEKELLEKLKKYDTYFQKVDIKDFDLLASLNPTELGNRNQEVYQITNLLKQISDYALLPFSLSEDEIETIENCLSSQTRLNQIEEIAEISVTCTEYIDILTSMDCPHPSVRNALNLIAGDYYYNDLIDTICELINYTDGDFQDKLMDYSHIIDDNVLDFIDNLFNQLQKKMDKTNLSNEELLLELTEYVKNKLALTNLFFTNLDKQDNIYYVDDSYIHYLMRNKQNLDWSNFNFNCLNTFSNLLSVIEEQEKIVMDLDILKLIDMVKDSYYLYQSYRYKYLKDTYREQQFLKKCKKM